MTGRAVARNPIKDQVAIIGLGSTGYTRQAAGRTQSSLALEACTRAVLDAGIDKSMIDGVVGTASPAAYVASALGLTDVRYITAEVAPFGHAVVQAMNALFAGSCDIAVAYHSVYRTGLTSRTAALDPFRRRSVGPPAGRDAPERVEGAVAYAAWASRYMYETGCSREDLGRVAVSDRANGCYNPLAVMPAPLTMDEYLAGRMVHEPLCLYDMDVPVDGADGGRVSVNPHGGALAEGATQGAGHIREAVLQLRGQAGERQVPGARVALVTPGGFFFNSQGLVLRRP